jgi:hypothetical protein
VVLDHGLAKSGRESAAAEALEAGLASGDVILTVLARQTQPADAAQHHHARTRLPVKIEPAMTA